MGPLKHTDSTNKNWERCNGSMCEKESNFWELLIHTYTSIFTRENGILSYLFAKNENGIWIRRSTLQSSWHLSESLRQALDNLSARLRSVLQRALGDVSSSQEIIHSFSQYSLSNCWAEHWYRPGGTARAPPKRPVFYTLSHRSSVFFSFLRTGYKTKWENDTIFFMSLFLTIRGWKEVGSCFLAWQEKKENVYAPPTHSLLLILYSPETSCFLWLRARVPEAILGSSSNRWYNIRGGEGGGNYCSQE